MTDMADRDVKDLLPKIDPDKPLPVLDASKNVVVTRGHYKGYIGTIVDWLPNAHCYVVELPTEIDNVGGGKSPVTLRLPFHWAYVETHTPEYDFPKREPLDRQVPSPWMEMTARIFGVEKNWMGLRVQQYRLTLLDKFESEQNPYYKHLIYTVLKMEVNHALEMFERDLFMAFGYSQQDKVAIKIWVLASKDMIQSIHEALKQEQLDYHYFRNRLGRIMDAFNSQVELLDWYELQHGIPHTRSIVDEEDDEEWDGENIDDE